MPDPQPPYPWPLDPQPLDPWPLRNLLLRTPRLTLAPDDEGLHELAALASRGVHPPAEMPFLQPWTDQPPEEMLRGTLQYHWGQRSRLAPSDWCVNFLVRHQGEVIDHLGAATARSGAFTDNPASLRVSERLGYRTDGSGVHVRRGERTTEIRLALERRGLVRPRWSLEVDGVDGCRTLLGAV